MRFEPGSLLEAILRPVFMALPQGWIYTEILAPDVRFLVAMALSLLFIIPLIWSGVRSAAMKRTAVMFVLLVASFSAWLCSSGNGRYFMPYMLMIGPMCVGLLYGTRMSRSMKSASLVVIFIIQSMAVWTNSPWNPFNAIELMRWTSRDYVDVDVGPVTQSANITYVSYTGQTYSLIDPLFPKKDSWINLSAFVGADFFNSDRLVVEARRRLASAEDLRVIVPSAPLLSDLVTGLPRASARNMMNNGIRQFGLVLDNGKSCAFLKSRTKWDMGGSKVGEEHSGGGEPRKNVGFWVCPITYTGVPPAADEFDARMRVGMQAIQKMERVCPRTFQRGQIQFRRTDNGVVRIYTGSDASLIYDHSNGGVYVQFFRALNPQWIGRASDIVDDDFHVECGSFISREAMPWDRNI